MIDFHLDQLVIQIINFLFLLVVLNYILYRPIRGMLKKRRETFEGFESDIAGLTNQVEERTREMEARLAEARRDGYQKKDEIKGQGLETEKSILSQANSEAESKVNQVKAQVKEEIASARDALKADLTIFSQELAQKILGRSLS